MNKNQQQTKPTVSIKHRKRLRNGTNRDRLVKLSFALRLLDDLEAAEDVLQAIMDDWHAEGPNTHENCKDTLCTRALTVLSREED